MRRGRREQCEGVMWGGRNVALGCDEEADEAERGDRLFVDG